MDAPPPVPPPPSPPTPAARAPERAALAVILVGLFLLLLYRGYGNRYAVQPSRQTTAVLPLDLNAADRTELLQIPGVGPGMADAILAHRDTFGSFQSIDELDSVRGIGARTLDKLRPWLTVDARAVPKQAEPKVETLVRPPLPPLPPPPQLSVVQPKKLEPGKQIDINTATAEELQQLPAIGPKLAERMIAERTKQPFESVEDLRRVSGIGVKTLEKLRPHVVVGK